MASNQSVLPRTFRMERYFAQYEFTTKHLLCCSDVEALSMRDVINMADDETRALWEDLNLSYTESSGHPLLRREVALLHDVTADDVLIITPQEGIYIAMLCLTDYLSQKYNEAKVKVVTTFPAYQSLYENLMTSQCDVKHWHSKLTDDGWTFDLDELRSLLTEDTRLLVVNFPHNPTGYIPTGEEWKEIINICRERNIFLFSDEMYRLTNNDGSEPLQSACALYDNSISLFGMSKTFALPGLRIGWLCTRQHDIMAKMESFKDYITICSSAPSEILSIIALRNRDQIITRTVELAKKNLNILESFLAKYQDIFEWHAPKACTTGFLRLKGWTLAIGTGGATAFCDALVREAEVLLLPGSMYHFTDEYVRLSFGRDNLSEGLAALKVFLDKHKPS